MGDSGDAPTRLDTTVKAIARAVPYVGSSLSVVYEDMRERQKARAESAIDALISDVGIALLLRRLNEDEELEVMFFESIEMAARTALRAKRLILRNVVAEAARDKAQVESSQLILAALRDLDAPHIRALARLIAAEESVQAGDTETQDPAGNLDTRRAKAVEATGKAEPLPVISVLIRVAAVLPITYVGGGIGVYRVSDFGRSILRYIDDPTTLA